MRVLYLAGRMGSGKSTLATELAKRLGWRRASFGDYVRSLANERGLPPTRESLQDLGALEVSSNVDRFCRAVLAHSGWDESEDLILDGIRHLEVVEALSQILPTHIATRVFVQLPEAERYARMKEREGREESSAMEMHSTEAQANALRDSADIVVSGHDIESAAAEVVASIRQTR